MVKRRFPTVRLGVKSLLLHKLRSFLTALGLLFVQAAAETATAASKATSTRRAERMKDSIWAWGRA
jgi:hypothetical protein